MQFWTLQVNHKYIFQIKGARNIADHIIHGYYKETHDT